MAQSCPPEGMITPLRRSPVKVPPATGTILRLPYGVFSIIWGGDNSASKTNNSRVAIVMIILLHFRVLLESTVVNAY